jgi:hypothetical protein
MKTLNFFPYYEPYLRQRQKTTTLRLIGADYQPGERVQLTVGWDEQKAKKLHDAIIASVYKKAIRDLTAADFHGESPDCTTPENAALVLSSIYRTCVTADQQIWVVKFTHVAQSAAAH